MKSMKTVLLGLVAGLERASEHPLAAALVADVVRETGADVVVTYDEHGGYGHPDHIQAHRVAMYAAQLAAVPSYRRDLGDAWDIAKIYWGAMSESRMREGLRLLREAGDTTSFEGMDPDGPLPPFVTVTPVVCVGLKFSQPTALTLSYRDCGLTGSLLGSVLLDVVYVDDKQSVLEILPSLNNLVGRTVTGRVDHFSGYALADRKGKTSDTQIEGF